MFGSNGIHLCKLSLYNISDLNDTGYISIITESRFTMRYPYFWGSKFICDGGKTDNNCTKGCTKGFIKGYEKGFKDGISIQVKKRTLEEVSHVCDNWKTN